MTPSAAIRSLRRGVLYMAVLVLLSVGTGYVFSLGATFVFDGPNFYEASSVLLTFILLGHWLEMRARAGASDTATAAACANRLDAPMTKVSKVYFSLSLVWELGRRAGGEPADPTEAGQISCTVANAASSSLCSPARVASPA